MATKDTRLAVMADKRKPIVSRLLPLTLCHHGASPRARHATREMLQIAAEYSLVLRLGCRPRRGNRSAVKRVIAGWPRR